MDSINGLLLNAGDAALWLGGALKTFFVAVFGAVDVVLNPILSRVLSVVNLIGTVVGDVVYSVLAPLPVWLGLTLLSAAAGVLMLITYRYTSNQVAIGRARDTMTANLLALKLFKDEIRVAFPSQRRLFGALLRWQWLMLKPMLIMILLLLPVFSQMGVRYQWRPLHSGEETLIKLRLNPDRANSAEAVLQPSPGLVEMVGPVSGGSELVWRVRAGEPGRYTLNFNLSGTVVEKELVVGDSFQRVSASRPARQWTAQILHPTESPFPPDSPVQSIEIVYGSVDSRIYGATWWIVYFIVISMISALLLLPFFKVRF